jgi:hypothetical protein
MFEQQDRLVGVACFRDDKAVLAEGVRNVHPNKRFIFDHENMYCVRHRTRPPLAVAVLNSRRGGSIRPV